MIWKPVVEFLTTYLKDKPFTDLLMVLGIGVFIWVETNHGNRTKHAHEILHTILTERDAAETRRDDLQERNVDRIVGALTGVKQEVKKSTAATEAVGEKIVEKKGE